jgi:hypothetical protein
MLSPLNKKGDEDDDDMNLNSSSAGLLREEKKDNDNDIPLCGCLSIRFYQPYFDVDTNEVIQRIMNAVFFCNRENNFMTMINDKPDAYGPFWIATTLVFSLAVTSHINNWLTSWLQQKAWEYDFQSVVTASSLVYTFAAGVPLSLWFIFRQLTEAKMKLITLICLYGYSLLVFIPATLLCLLPSSFLTWVFLLAASGASALFLLRNLAPVILQHAPAQKQIFLPAVAIVQLIFTLILKFSFYSMK